MSWKFWIDVWESNAEIQDTTLFSPIRFDGNYVIEYIRTWVGFVGTPTFTNMQMKIYGNDEEASDPTPAHLLYTSTNNWAFSDISNEAHGLKEIWFKFTPFHVKQNVYINCVINADSYFPNASSYLGWEKAYPNPIAQTGYTPSTINVPNSPYKIYALGSKL